MDSYLSIAEQVLRRARRPLSAREILNRAYLEDLVPSQLHGNTQHKTLGARLSEDILARRERSIFFRTSPGSFFLRSFIEDPSIPEKYRKPIQARRRQRELVRGRILSISRKQFLDANDEFIPATNVLHLFDSADFHYRSKLPDLNNDELAVWSFVVVTRGKRVLTYRHGKYREGRDEFLKQKSIGFFAPVIESDVDIFDRGDKGIISSGLRAVIMDLDLPPSGTSSTDYEARTSLDCFLSPSLHITGPNLLAVLRFECPDWFEPVGRRLAINDLRWIDLLTPLNSIEDFDPWSRRIFEWIKRKCGM